MFSSEKGAPENTRNLGALEQHEHEPEHVLFPSFHFNEDVCK